METQLILLIAIQVLSAFVAILSAHFFYLMITSSRKRELETLKNLEEISVKYVIVNAKEFPITARKYRKGGE